VKLLAAELGHDALDLLVPHPYKRIDLDLASRTMPRRPVQPQPSDDIACEFHREYIAGSLPKAKPHQQRFDDGNAPDFCSHGKGHLASRATTAMVGMVASASACADAQCERTAFEHSVAEHARTAHFTSCASSAAPPRVESAEHCASTSLHAVDEARNTTTPHQCRIHAL
jgi:hypothetical protein